MKKLFYKNLPIILIPIVIIAVLLLCNFIYSIIINNYLYKRYNENFKISDIKIIINSRSVAIPDIQLFPNGFTAKAVSINNPNLKFEVRGSFFAFLIFPDNDTCAEEIIKSDGLKIISEIGQKQWGNLTVLMDYYMNYYDEDQNQFKNISKKNLSNIFDLVEGNCSILLIKTVNNNEHIYRAEEVKKLNILVDEINKKIVSKKSQLDLSMIYVDQSTYENIMKQKDKIFQEGSVGFNRLYPREILLDQLIYHKFYNDDNPKPITVDNFYNGFSAP